jgi:hypothetical protein
MTQGTRCKPGDLAYIIRASVPENIGRVVQVIERDLSLGANDPNPGEVRWHISMPDNSYGIDRTTGGRYLVPPGQCLSAPDANLRPISGVPLDEEVTEDEELEVPA